MSDVSSAEHWDSRDWLGLRWSAWMPLMAAHPLALAQLPADPGLYRIRRTDRPSDPVWTGWATAGIRESVERLARQVHLPLEPYDDPNGPALALWKARARAAASFQVSGVGLDPGGERGSAVAQELEKLTRHKTVTGCDE